MSRDRTVRLLIATTVAVLSVASITCGGAANAAVAPSGAVPVTVLSTRAFTATGLEVRAGDTVTVHASGQIAFRPGAVAPATPAGIPWGPDCTAIAQQVVHTPWPLPGKPCWSVIGKIGSAPPFEIGRGTSFKAKAGGQLLLGINDNNVKDNVGAWTAAVTVTRPSGVPVTTVPVTTVPGAGPVTASHHSSSRLPTIAAMIAGLFVVGLLLWFVVARRRRADTPARSKPPAPVPAPEVRVPVAVAPGPPPAVALTTEGTAAVPLDPESTDVNIFRVGLPGGTSLHVGYSLFPEGTIVFWRVSREGVTRAAGSFTTEGGGGAQHFETLPLGVTIDPDEPAVDVSFSWTIGDVPFGYSVRRQPGS